MFELRDDAYFGQLIFWSSALVIWLLIRLRSRKAEDDQ